MIHKRSIIRLFRPLAFSLFFVSLAFAGFGQSALAQPQQTEEHLQVILKDFRVHPNATQAKAGWLTLTAVNEGMSTHELVILRTDLNPAELPRKEAKDPSGMVTGYLVNEEDTTIETIDEIEEFPAGTSQVKKVFLDPGHYVLFCNISRHYDKGMYTSLHIVQ